MPVLLPDSPGAKALPEPSRGRLQGRVTHPNLCHRFVPGNLLLPAADDSVERAGRQEVKPPSL